MHPLCATLRWGEPLGKKSTVMKKAVQSHLLTANRPKAEAGPGLHGNLSIESIGRNLSYTFPPGQIEARRKMKKEKRCFFLRPTTPLFSTKRLWISKLLAG